MSCHERDALTVHQERLLRATTIPKQEKAAMRWRLQRGEIFKAALVIKYCGLVSNIDQTAHLD
jgi:hypothetical protein